MPISFRWTRRAVKNDAFLCLFEKKMKQVAETLNKNLHLECRFLRFSQHRGAAF